MNRKILLILAIFIVSMMNIAAAVSDIQILPEVDPITVLVYPNPISPPVKINYSGWSTDGNTSYRIWIVNDTSLAEVCSVNGTISSDPETFELTGCILPASSIGVPHSLYAKGECPRGGCADTIRSKLMQINSGIMPVPELNTAILVSAGLIGMFGLIRTKRE